MLHSCLNAFLTTLYPKELDTKSKFNEQLPAVSAKTTPAAHTKIISVSKA